MIMRMGDIKSCRISTDENDEITGIHLVAASSDPPEEITDMVCGALNKELGLDLDQSLVGVVVLDSVQEEEMDEITQPAIENDRPADNEPAEPDRISSERHKDNSFSGEEPHLEFLERDLRIIFKGLNLHLEENKVRAEVIMEMNELQVSGFAEGIRKDHPFYSVIARATLDGVAKFIDEKFQLCLSGIEQVKISKREAFVASIQVVDGRKVLYLSGSAFLGRDANEASVLAVLDALNRPFGRWKSRKYINYRIR